MFVDVLYISRHASIVHFMLCVEAIQKASRKKKSGRDLTKGSPFQPDYVYSVLHKMHSSLTVRVSVCVCAHAYAVCINVSVY